MSDFLVAGNWKMNGLADSVSEAVRIAEDNPSPRCEIVIFPPAALLSRMSDRLSGSSVRLGGQDCHTSESGAHTGDHSAQMLADAGAEYVILGHSERRRDHNESSDMVNRKVRAAWRAGLKAIVCVGETAQERDAGGERAAVGAQLEKSIPDDASPDRLAVAYEPVWAIGTGRTAGPGEIGEMHSFIRQTCVHQLAGTGGGMVKLLYGGSVSQSNAASIFAVPEVSGVLVGGASLKAAGFTPIIRSVPAN